MAVQTSYPDTQPAAVAGHQATQIPATLISRTVETAALAFGKPVAQGTDDKGCTLFAGTEFIGISLLDRSAAGTTVTNGQVVSRAPDVFGVGESARIMTKGDVWVVASVAVDAGDPVYATTAGAFAKATGGGNVLIPGARWDTSAGIGALAVVRLG